MDCISVYMAGIRNVIATSGTAFTEAQIRLIGRFTKRVIVNFDPDTAGIAATEKSIALLTEEDFEVKVVTLEGGLDPDRFIREQGVQSYMAALRSARRHSDYLIDHAREQFPGRTSDAKVKALNFLLPHIRRIPNRIQRDEFAADAAQKLGIDSAILRQELKQAAPSAAKASDPTTTTPPAKPSASCCARLFFRITILPELSPLNNFPSILIGMRACRLPRCSKFSRMLLPLPIRWTPQSINTIMSCWHARCSRPMSPPTSIRNP